MSTDSLKIRNYIYKGMDKVLSLEAEEIWKKMPHPLFKHKYLVSNKGDVMNVRKGTMRIQSGNNGYCGINTIIKKNLH